jgi:7-keto-8-aminopelargonate synthetase-like enzyme
MGAGVAGAMSNSRHRPSRAAPTQAANSAYHRANATNSMMGTVAGAFGNLGGIIAGAGAPKNMLGTFGPY